MTLREIAELTGGWVDPANADVRVDSVASLDDASSGDISFFGSPKYLKNLRRSAATAVLVPHGFGEEVPAIRIWVDSPSAAFAKVLERFAPPVREYQGGTHATAVVAPTARIAENVHIGPHVVIEDHVEIGAGTVILAGSFIGQNTRIGSSCFLHPRVTIADRCILGHRVTLHSGVVIGSDGFGYEFRDGAHQKIPQTGIVQIDDDVEIGANTTVDRARFGRTWIKHGTKIDNLVQIAHNVTIGAHCILCAQVGVSGSTRVGNGVTMAGKVGVNGHIEIGDGAIITAMAGITKSVPPKEILVGLPGRPMREYKENYALLKNISKLYARVSQLEDKISGDQGRTH